MIIIKFRGRLGNQLFRYSLGRIIADKLHTFLILDTTDYTGSDIRFFLEDLNIRYNLRITSNRLLSVLTSAFHPKTVMDYGYSKPDTRFFQKQILETGNNTILDGCWESYKYFMSAIPNLKKYFRLKNPSQDFLLYTHQIHPKYSIAVHVRRGDFLHPADHHTVLSKGYFHKAVQHIIKETSNPGQQIVIFSDDPVWCKKELNELAGYKTTIFQNSAVSDTEQFFLMSMFAHNVTSNSTYSWWASYINPRPDKIVVTPQKWFKNEILNAKAVKDLIPSNWQMI
jgi:hypothetical protein